MSDVLTILCAGAYGIRNAGDDLPLVALAECMRELLPNRVVNFRALSRHPDPWEEKQFGVPMIQNLEYESAAASRGRWFKGMNADDDPAPLDRVRREIKNCDLLVLGAGNALIDLSIGLLRGPVPLFAVYASLARLYDRPVMLYGMSVGPLTTEWGRDLSRGLLKEATVVTVRDQPSQAMCLDLLNTPREIHLFPDSVLAASLPPPARGLEVMATEGLEIPAGRPLIALGLRDLARVLGEEDGARLKQAVVRMMDHLKERFNFLLIPQATGADDDDRVLARHLETETQATCLTIKQRHHPLDLIALYGLATATLAVRLHAAVFASMAGTPTVAVNYLPKVAGFMESLGDLGVTIAMNHLSADSLAKGLVTQAELDTDSRARLATRVDQLRVQARGHAKVAISQGLGL